MTVFTDTSAAIGRQLGEEAVWHEGQCAWVGVVPAPPSPSPAPVAAAALGPDLYGGTSGVGLFLGHLFALTGEPGDRLTCIGAMRHALARAAGLPPQDSLGLYTGRLGIALAALRCGGAVGSEEVADGGRVLAATLLDAPDPQGLDLISGSAGAVVGLLALAQELSDARFADAASRHGRQLSEAVSDRAGTGMAHGAAGMIHALLELATATRSADWLSAVERLESHERASFDARAGNWPDNREIERRALAETGFASGVAWCHGAPGILLSRRRAWTGEGLGGAHEMQAAAFTTQRWLRAALASGRGNFSLCHGVAGNAEALADGNGRSQVTRELVVAVAGFGAEEYGGTGAVWPCGTPGGETPGLMLGIAGVGLFYLRLGDPAIGSVLAPGPTACDLSAAPLPGGHAAGAA